MLSRSLRRKLLAKKLASNRKALQRALADAPGLDLDGIPMARQGMPGQGGQGPGQGQGQGGVSRGRGDAELTLGEQHDLGTTRREKIGQPLDPERAAPDELLAVVEGEHEIDETAYTGPRAGGAAKDGDGGSAAQVDALLPAEQATVRRFFE